MKQRINLTDILLATQVIIVDDPPYYQWMFNRLEKINTKAVVIHSSATAMKSTAQLFPQLERSHWFQFPTLSLAVLPESRGFVDRPVDLLIPARYQEPEDILHLKSLVEPNKFLKDLFEHQLSSWTETSKTAGKGTLEILYEFLNGYIKDDSDKISFLRQNLVILSFLERLDTYRRNTHRLQVIRDVLKTAIGKVIIFDALSFPYETRAQVSIVPPCSGADFFGLIQKSKYLLDPGIPGTSGIHQRAKTAMSLQTGLITNSQFFLETDLEHFWWTPDGLTAELWGANYIDQWNSKVQEAFRVSTIYDGSDFERLPAIIETYTSGFNGSQGRRLP